MENLNANKSIKEQMQKGLEELKEGKIIEYTSGCFSKNSV